MAMNITLRQLRYFVEIANSRSFSRAAEHLSIAQPALSQNIAALEAELGAVLFKRHARGIALSEAGQLLLTQALDLLARTDSLKEGLEGRETKPSGLVRLSIVGSLAGILMGPLMKAVAQNFPDIELMVKEGLSSEVRNQVESGAAQLAAMPSPSELQGMESMALFEERFMLFGTRAAMRKLPAEIPFAQLGGLVLAEPDRAHDLRKIIEREANAIGHKLNVRYELNSPSLLISMVREGLAYAVMPASSCQDAVMAKSIFGRLVVQPELKRVQAVVWPSDRPLSLAATAVRETLIGVVGQLVEKGRLQGRMLSSSYQKN